MKHFPRILVVVVLLGVVLSGCFCLEVAPESAELCDGPVRLTVKMKDLIPSEQALTAQESLLPEAPDHRSGTWLAWYRDWELVGEENVTRKGHDYEAEFWADEPGAYWAIVWECGRFLDIPLYVTDGASIVTACGQAPCTRADVAVVIYGGWDGLAVNAYVGGTAQETMYTAQDAFGDAAVLWTFYPPHTGWNVSVAPQTPPGKDPAEWKYELVRIETKGGSTVENPTSADAIIYPCCEKVFYFQLVHNGTE